MIPGEVAERAVLVDKGQEFAVRNARSLMLDPPPHAPRMTATRISFRLAHDLVHRDGARASARELRRFLRKRLARGSRCRRMDIHRVYRSRSDHALLGYKVSSIRPASGIQQPVRFAIMFQILMGIGMLRNVTVCEETVKLEPGHSACTFEPPFPSITPRACVRLSTRSPRPPGD